MSKYVDDLVFMVKLDTQKQPMRNDVHSFITLTLNQLDRMMSRLNKTVEPYQTYEKLKLDVEKKQAKLKTVTDVFSSGVWVDFCYSYQELLAYLMDKATLDQIKHQRNEFDVNTAYIARNTCAISHALSCVNSDRRQVLSNTQYAKKMLKTVSNRVEETHDASRLCAILTNNIHEFCRRIEPDFQCFNPDSEIYAAYLKLKSKYEAAVRGPEPDIDLSVLISDYQGVVKCYFERVLSANVLVRMFAGGMQRVQQYINEVVTAFDKPSIDGRVTLIFRDYNAAKTYYLNTPIAKQCTFVLFKSLAALARDVSTCLADEAWGLTDAQNAEYVQPLLDLKKEVGLEKNMAHVEHALTLYEHVLKKTRRPYLTLLALDDDDGYRRFVYSVLSSVTEANVRSSKKYQALTLFSEFRCNGAQQRAVAKLLEYQQNKEAGAETKARHKGAIDVMKRDLVRCVFADDGISVVKLDVFAQSLVGCVDRARGQVLRDHETNGWLGWVGLSSLRDSTEVGQLDDLKSNLAKAFDF